jgi:hypothetical protein
VNQRKSLKKGYWLGGRLVISVLILIVMGGITSIIVHSFGAGGGNASASSPSVCTGIIPKWKCSLSVPDGLPTTTSVSPGDSTPVTSPAPFYPSSTTTACGSGFFTSNTDALITAQFGQWGCFQFANSETWILVGSGTPDGNSAAPGGAIIALDNCSESADANCMNPDENHDFSSFNVYYPPAPSEWPLEVETTFGNELVLVTNGPCGQYIFDANSPGWFGSTEADITSVMTGGQISKIEAPQEATGSTAITSAAPASTDSSCQANS